MKNSTLQIITWSVCIFFIVTVPLSYCIKFQELEMSNKPESWGQFGDYFGGILNPIISLINLVILTFLSIRLVKDEDSRNKWTLQELARPYGDISFSKSPWVIKIAINNCGLGPMIVKNITIKGDNGNTFNNFSSIVKPLSNDVKVVIGAFKISSHCVISKDSELEILSIEVDRNDPNSLKYLKDIDLKLKGYTIEIQYEDMYHRPMETLVERISLSFFED